MHIATRIFLTGLDLVIPTAGISASALIRVAVVEVAGEQAAPGVGNAQGAMHEDFKLNIRAFLPDFSHFIERQFARENDARHAKLLPEAHGGKVHGIGLHRQMHRHLRPGFAHHHDQTGVSHDQRVGLERHHRRHVGQIGAYLGVVRQNVADNVKQFAAGMRLANCATECFNIAKIVVTHPQTVSRLPGIDCIGTKGIGGAHHGE